MMQQDSITVHASHPDGHEGYVLLLRRPDPQGRVSWREWSSDDYVLLLHRPDSQGRVSWREWSSDDYVGPPREGSSSIDEVEQRLREWAQGGWKLSESVHLVDSWLRGS
jgi:hypothetical protein